MLGGFRCLPCSHNLLLWIIASDIPTVQMLDSTAIAPQGYTALGCLESLVGSPANESPIERAEPH
jgi:hypothetical protein